MRQFKVSLVAASMNMFEICLNVVIFLKSRPSFSVAFR